MPVIFAAVVGVALLGVTTWLLHHNGWYATAILVAALMGYAMCTLEIAIAVDRAKRKG
jgi:hypothetical protein